MGDAQSPFPFQLPWATNERAGTVPVLWSDLRRYLSSTAIEVWKALRGLAQNGTDGQVFPGVEYLTRYVARVAAVTTRTVQRALARLRDAGLVRDLGREGWRYLRQVFGRHDAEPGVMLVPTATIEWMNQANPRGRPRKRCRPADRKGVVRRSLKEGTSIGSLSSREMSTLRADPASKKQKTGAKRPRLTAARDGVASPAATLLSPSTRIGEAGVALHPSSPCEAHEASSTVSVFQPSTVRRFAAPSAAVAEMSEEETSALEAKLADLCDLGGEGGGTPPNNEGKSDESYAWLDDLFEFNAETSTWTTKSSGRLPKLLYNEVFDLLPPLVLPQGHGPFYPYLSESMSDRERVDLLLRAYRAAVNAEFGGKTNNYRQWSERCEWYPRLVEAAKMMIADRLAPHAWARWMIQLINKDQPKAKWRAPLKAIYSHRMLKQYSGWCRSEMPPSTRSSVIARKAAERLRELQQRAQHVAQWCDTREEVREAMLDFDPEYRTIYAAAEVEVKQRTAELWRQMDQDGWVW